MTRSRVGAFGAVVVGALLAGAVAVALSPLGPIGPVRPVYPSRGIAFDWTVLGVGVAVMIGVLGALSVVLAPGASLTVPATTAATEPTLDGTVIHESLQKCWPRSGGC